MSITPAECERVLATMAPADRMYFLAQVGHTLTVMARDAYEFQGPGVTKPRLLRDLNEIHHRIYPHIYCLLRGSTIASDLTSLAHWLTGEGRSAETKAACFFAFEQALKRVSKESSK